MSQLYIGLMSGTSMDSIDAALVDIASNRLVAKYEEPIPIKLKEDLQQLVNGTNNELHKMAILDKQVGGLFANAVDGLLTHAAISSKKIVAIGSHGQTVRHHPSASYPYTLQIGCANTIAEKTGITVVSDFRRADMACGGQGAPFAPLYHRELFTDKDKKTVVLNIGGIANISCIDTTGKGIGFDTGPGNTLMDAYVKKKWGKPFDESGDIARQGKCQEALLSQLMATDYFTKSPPKSTGTEYFNLAWLMPFLKNKMYKPEDVLATLLALTVNTIVDGVNRAKFTCARLIVCGGGAKNKTMIAALKKHFTPVYLSSELGYDASFIEAMLFAWLAYKRVNNEALDLYTVTGAYKPAFLGGIYSP